MMDRMPMEPALESLAPLALLCRDTIEYAASVLDCDELTRRERRTLFPVLGETPPAGFACLPYSMSASRLQLGRLDERDRVRLCLRAAANASVDACAYLPDDAVGALCAAAFARWAYRRLVDLTDRPASGAHHASVVVIVSAEWLTEYGVTWFQERIEDAQASAPGARRVPFGIITADGAERLSDLLFRTLHRTKIQSHRAGVVWERDEFRPLGLNDGSDDVGLVRVDVKAVRHPLVFVRGHGMDYCALGGHLCSAPARTEESRRCVAGLECRNSLFPRHPVSKLCCDIAFLETCGAGNFPGSLEPRENLATRVIQAGASTVVACTGLYYYHSALPVVAARLLSHGMPLGRMIACLNEWIRQSVGIADSLVLFGDPKAAAFAENRPMPILAADACPDGAVGVDVPRLGTQAEFFLLESEDLAYRILRDPLHCSEQPQGALPAQAFLHRLDDRLLLLSIFSGRDQSGRFMFAPQRLEPEDVEGAFVLLGRLAADTAMADSAVRDRFEELAVTLREIGTRSGAERHSADASGSTFDALKRLRSRLAHAGASLVQCQAQAYATQILRSQLLDVVFEETGPVVRDGTMQAIAPSPCPTCGRALRQAHYAVWGLRRDRRVQLACERCGPMCDVPLELGPVWIEAPSRVALGERFAVRVRGRNPWGTPAWVAVAGCIGMSLYHLPRNACKVEPVSGVASIAPGASFSVALACSIGEEGRASAWDLRVVVSLGGAVALSTRRIVFERRLGA